MARAGSRRQLVVRGRSDVGASRDGNMRRSRTSCQSRLARGWYRSATLRNSEPTAGRGKTIEILGGAGPILAASFLLARSDDRLQLPDLVPARYQSRRSQCCSKDAAST
jgi:hypothetical protein